MARDKFARLLASRGLGAQDLFNGYAALIRLAVPAAVPPVVDRDPDDEHVIACAVAAQADLIVSSDRDLLDLTHFDEVQIVDPATALAQVAGSE